MKIKNVFEPLFSFGTDYLSNACINSYNEPITLYSAGYKEAARRLTERALNESGSIDILVFPIIFLYRHYLELKLKEIILNGTDLLYSNPIITTGHSFSNLWNLANPLIEEVYKDEKDKEPLQLLKHVINEFIKIDQNSIAFRYPLTVDKKPSLPGIEHINIRRFSEYMEKASELLDGISGGISDYKDYKNEMLRT